MNLEDLSWTEVVLIMVAAAIVFWVGSSIPKPVNKPAAPTCVVKPRLML